MEIWYDVLGLSLGDIARLMAMGIIASRLALLSRLCLCMVCLKLMVGRGIAKSACRTFKIMKGRNANI